MFGIFKLIFGTKNDREIKRLRKMVEDINKLEPEIKALSDRELKDKTIEFKERLSKGETLDNILVDAFAVVREASTRVLGLTHFDEQLMGGIVLHEGKITEMKTGEGKTLVATCPVYLNALEGKGVHVITVNDYLAKRDRDEMGRIYEFLGLSAGVILNEISKKEKKKAYMSDVTYGTNSEFGFDYLRDNMVDSLEEKVQRKLNYCIVDEVDSILIDEARTPLIISGASSDVIEMYKIFRQVANILVRSTETEKIKDVKTKRMIPITDDRWEDYEIDEKSKNVVLTEKGVKKVEKLLKLDNLYSAEHIELTHYLTQALRAKELFTKDKDYLIRDGQVIIIDEFTGRALNGRRYSDGLHQALEAKEEVKVAGENQTLASITLQNYFRMYKKLAGMTGTAETEASEFMHTYGLEVVVVPTHMPMIRKDNLDLVYKTKKEKIDAIVDKIKELNNNGQPVLVGTISIKSSEELSERLKEKKIIHSVLNAKFHAKEAEIVAQAGRYKSVTIATNMAGRGTDIMLGGNPDFLAIKECGTRESDNFKESKAKYIKQCEEEKQKVLESGGLFILGTERHESRRIDNQLRGRSGRQGDPGVSEFYLSLEDDLMRLFGSDRAKKAMEMLKYPEGEPIMHSMVDRRIASAQTQIESLNFGRRKNLLEFDDVMNKQRNAIYASRNEALGIDNLEEKIIGMLLDTVQSQVSERFQSEFKEDWDIKGLSEYLFEKYGYEIEDLDEYKSHSVEEYSKKIYERLLAIYKEKEASLGFELMRKLEKYILLDVVDGRWREHLKSLDGLREGIYLRAYGQKDPVVEYKLLSGELYEQMLITIKEQTTSFLFKVIIKNPEEDLEPKEEEIDNIKYIGGNESEIEETPSKNSLCPCGSGKKYKNCCGRLKN
ncbi:MAG: preprotein translocase subunit SecA [Fusobacteriaceae bacterium]|jgi:preprotein translocase subunit SecA|nr:preprotein translocase subunit SecA [Fusobacteriaceae bacterium]